MSFLGVMKMSTQTTHTNRLIDEKSPYLLQHAHNPVDWYPWGDEAFEKAKAEDKPVFLSIGYSTCHWCHVMAHESFEDSEVAEILNKHYVAIKVDKEERPDVDSIYMSVCEAFTGSGGWPTSIFMTAEQKPFFAGTYFPKNARYGSVGFKDLLLKINENWNNDRETLLNSADEITEILKNRQTASSKADENILEEAVEIYKKSYDEKYGGFGDAPKFPAPHNLLFLMQQAEKHNESGTLKMAETTLLQMYRGGMFDHIGFGFCRYSTDRYYLVPHFEKMLYDNAMMILAYCKAFDITKKPIFKDISEKTAFYILSEMTSPEGGFYSAQDADSEGEEGKYYLFSPEETEKLLGENEATEFNKYFDITKDGNFEGKSIPNLLSTETVTDRFDEFLPKIREYRRKRHSLYTDDKILTFWNSLMIAALCALYKVSRKSEYLKAAKRADDFITNNLSDGDTLYVSFRNKKHSSKGFLDDYAGYVFALLSLYDATLETSYLDKAEEFAKKAINDFYDNDIGGFYLYGSENETLIIKPKETYDGAVPSGNSLMTYNLVGLNLLSPNKKREKITEKQLKFMSGEAERYPAGYSMFLKALSDYLEPPIMITAVIEDNKHKDKLKELPFNAPLGSVIKVICGETEDYMLKNNKITYYICQNHSCLAPTNDFPLKINKK